MRTPMFRVASNHPTNCFVSEATNDALPPPLLPALRLFVHTVLYGVFALFFMAALMGSPRAAQAQYPGSDGGSYAVTYSGGTYTEMAGSYPQSGSYSVNSNGQYGASVNPEAVSGQTASCSCSGTITATFTWNNGGNANNLPPASVVLVQTCDAGWMCEANGNSGSSSPAASGSCSNPLGGAAVPDSSTLGAGWQATSYTVKSNLGSSFQITASPSAQATENGTLTFYGSEARVKYSATANVPTITLTGTTLVNGAQEALAGQQIKAALNVPVATVTSYTFSINGGS